MSLESFNQSSPAPISVHIIDGYCATAIGIKYLIEKDKSLRVSAVSHTMEDALTTIEAISSDVILLEPELPLNGGKELIPLIAEKTQSRVLLFSGTSNPSRCEWHREQI
jgi:response regulator of citrate/malate metabolism